MSLLAFEAAARHLSFTRAALELSLTPTAVSHQIKNLEELLGASLFSRNNNKLSMTETAENYLRVVRDSILNLSFATDRAAEEKDERVLTVQCLETFAITRLMPHLRDFHRQHPQFSLRLRTGYSMQIANVREFDAAIMYGAGGWPGVVAYKLGIEEVFPVCSPLFLAKKPPLRRPEDLRTHTVVRTSSLLLRDEWPLWLEAAGISGIDFCEQVSCDHLAASIQAAIGGVGVVLGRSSVVSRELELGRLVEPFDIRATSPFAYYLVVPEHSSHTRKAQLFTKWMTNSLGAEDTRVPVPTVTRLERASPKQLAARSPFST
jgi:LysR family glycine cleavage system transcriptional activator